MNSNVSSMWVDYKFKTTSQRHQHWKLPICIIFCTSVFVNLEPIESSGSNKACHWFHATYPFLVAIWILCGYNSRLAARYLLWRNWFQMASLIFCPQFYPFKTCFFVLHVLQNFRFKRYSPKRSLSYIMSVIAHIMVQ